MSAVGEKVPKFHIPVCTSFQAKILNKKLCYEIDLNGISNNYNIDIEKKLELGLAFIMDYNEDRHINFYRSINESSKIRSIISTAQSVKNWDANIYLNTLGNVMIH